MTWWKHGRKSREAHGCGWTWRSDTKPEKCPRCGGTTDIWQIGTC